MERAARRQPFTADYTTQMSTPKVRVASLAPYFMVGAALGIVLTKSEAVSWFRIQEMFRFGSFHMYGLFASAVLVAGASIALLRRANASALSGEPIDIPRKTRFHRYWIGGTMFGVGWALTGACPGPLFTLVGSGVTVMLVAILSALTGTWAYALVRPKLPH